MSNHHPIHAVAVALQETGVQISAGGTLGGLGSWLVINNTLISSICMIVGVTVTVAGFIVTLKRNKRR